MSSTGIRQYGRRNLPRGLGAGVKIQHGDVALGALTRAQLNDRHQYFNFRSTPTMMLKGTAGAVPSGATGSVNILNFGGEGSLEQHMLGAGQTIIVPVLKDDGIEISADQADNEGMELCAGITSRSSSAFLVGTDPAFFFRVRAVIDDVSGADHFYIGWRKNQAYQADINTYTDIAALNLNAGQWYSETALNDAAITATDLGASHVVANLGAFEVMVKVSAAGVVTYEVGTAGDRSTPSLAPSFTFDTGDLVVPFIYFLHSADLADSVRLRQWEAGFQVNFAE